MENQRTSLFLTANLASEISRFVNAFEKKDQEFLRGAYTRTQNILNELETVPDMEGRTGEISILRNVLSDMVEGGGQTRVTPRFLKGYFMPVALRFMSFHNQKRS